jgi:hypothetical protein
MIDEAQGAIGLGVIEVLHGRVGDVHGRFQVTDGLV